jgi:hypothetical protein
MPTRETIGKRLHRLCTARSLSQLSSPGVSYAYISREMIDVLLNPAAGGGHRIRRVDQVQGMKQYYELRAEEYDATSYEPALENPQRARDLAAVEQLVADSTED